MIHEIKESYHAEAVTVFDNGGETIDRYTIVDSRGDIYGSSDNPSSPVGFWGYAGNIKETKWRDLNTMKQKAVAEIGKIVPTEKLPKPVLDQFKKAKVESKSYKKENEMYPEGFKVEVKGSNVTTGYTLAEFVKYVNKKIGTPKNFTVEEAIKAFNKDQIAKMNPSYVKRAKLVKVEKEIDESYKKESTNPTPTNKTVTVIDNDDAVHQAYLKVREMQKKGVL